MKNKEKNFISAVVYVKNNETTIKKFIEKLDKKLKEKFNDYEIIIVNDASTDNSIKMIKEYSIENKKTSISLINMSFYQGTEQSMVAGVDLAIGDFVFEFDYVNNNYDMELLYTVYKKSLEGNDIVRCINKNKKKNLSNIFYKIFNKFTRLQYKLESEDFRLLSRRGINRIKSLSSSIPYRKALYSNCGLKMADIYYEGEKKHNIKNIRKDADIAINSLIIFTDVAYKFAIMLSILFILFTISTAIYSLIVFINEKTVPGYTSTILLLSFAFFGIFMFFSIMIKYLSIIVDLIFKKQQYIVESVDKVNR